MTSGGGCQQYVTWYELRGPAHAARMTVKDELVPCCFCNWLSLLVQVPYAPGSPAAIAQRIDAIMGIR